MVKIEKLSLNPLYHGASPCWDNKAQAMYFTDLEFGHIIRHDHYTKSNLKLTLENKPVGFIIPIFNHANNFICGEGIHVKRFKWDLDRNIAEDVEILETISGLNDIQINHGKCDGCGHLWLGTASNVTYNRKQGGLYTFGMDKGVIKQVADLYTSSGVAWNRSYSKLFHTDSSNTTVDSYNYDIANGFANFRQTAFDIRKFNIVGNPHGITSDERGNLWVACYGGSQIINVNPETGTLLTSIKLPANQITDVGFGGLYLEELYVTTAADYTRSSDRERYSDAGSIFRITDLYVKGSQVYEFLAD
ncbi:hypothetical protein O3M35_011078 [Rhynocoris fuscipes]|uniref:Regucalcin n=1 Tax=Rhynocoris fuscipes TaxID=488301 RepID=A0AAW1CUG8_9HEMI